MHTKQIKGLVLLFILSISNLALADRNPWPVMSQEQRKEHLQSFKQGYALVDQTRTASTYDSNKVSKVLAQKIFNKHQAKNSKKKDTHLRLWENEYAVKKILAKNRKPVGLVFNNDCNYPEKYIGSDVFDENQDPLFAKNKTHEILTKYLGENYAELNAVLDVVTKIIVIDVEIDTVEEFAELLKNPALIDVNHIGNPRIRNVLYSPE